MGYPESQSQQGIDELRAILLGEDRQAMDGLRAQISQQAQQLDACMIALEKQKLEITQLRERVGDDAQLRQSIVPVLSLAMADVEKDNPKPLARAMSPFIVSSIRSEIANSKEAMVEALYPITGRLVSAAVKNSVASMMETINRRVDDATSARMISARYNSWRTGEPISAFLMQGPGEVNFHSVMLMERDTGAPICHVDPEGAEPRLEGQSNLVSGLLAALSNLTEEVFTGADDELRTLDLNGRKITLRRSLRHLLVVEFVGTLSADQHRLIDERFGEIVSLSANNDQQGLTLELTALMQMSDGTAGDAVQKKMPIGTVIGFGLIAVLAWYAIGVWQRTQLDNAAQRLDQQISATQVLSSYPISVSGDYDTKVLHVSGLIPESYDPLILRTQWQELSSSYPVEVDLALITDASRSKQFEQELKVLRAENRILRLNGQQRSDINTLSEQLLQLIKDQRFLIGLDGQLVDDGSALPKLRRVARLLVAGGMRLQVVGLASEGTLDDDSHPNKIAKILRGLGVGSEQLQIAVQPSTEVFQGGKQVVLEIVGKLP